MEANDAVSSTQAFLSKYIFLNSCRDESVCTGLYDII